MKLIKKNFELLVILGVLACSILVIGELVRSNVGFKQGVKCHVLGYSNNC